MTTADELRFTAPDGTYWSVYEVSASADQPWAKRSLIFVSDNGFRRVYNYPFDWRKLTPSELFDLSWKR